MNESVAAAQPPISRNEFIALMALLMSSVALSVDSMLPAFPTISAEYSVTDPRKIQMIVAALFLGHAPGQLIFGPLSDAIGRKKPIYIGLGLFIVGSVISGFASSFSGFIAGRFLQGFGGASSRIVSMAIVRDQYSGNAMAQIMSLIMMIFILVPAIAPAMGQGILFFGSWRSIFIVLCAFGFFIWTWFALRQKETLAVQDRRKLSFKDLWEGTKITFTQSTTLICMMASGMIFGIFVAYLGAVQSLFQNIYGITTTFPMYFAMLALSIGAASFSNSQLVVALGMRRLILSALAGMAVLANVFALYLVLFAESEPSFWIFMTYMLLTFFTVGLLFGNLNALAMEPLGHVAGIGSSLLGFVQNLLAVAIGVPLGAFFHDSILPLVLSFGTISAICIFLFLGESRFRKLKTMS